MDSVTRRSWFWAMDQLHKPRPGVPAGVSRLQVPVADTVLYRDNEPSAWIFTSKDGEVLRRHTKRCRTELVVEGVVRRSLEDAAAAGARLPHVAVVRRGTDTAVDVKATLLTEEDLSGMVGDGGGGSGLTANLLAIQACVHARAGSGTRFRCDASRELDGLVMRYTVQKLCYLGAPTTADAPHPRSVAGAKFKIGPAFALKSTMNRFNDRLSELSAALVSHLEAVGRTRVVRMQADFVLDAATDGPMLISIPLVHTAVLPKPVPLVTSASLSTLSASDSAVAGALIAAASSASLAPSGQPSPSRTPKSPKSPSRCGGSGGAQPAGGKSKELLGSITGAFGARGGRPGSQKQCGNTAAGSEPTLGKPRVGSAINSQLSLPPTSIHETPLLDKPNRPASGGGLRPGPWMRLHPPIPKGFAYEGDRLTNMSDLRGRKQLLCCGDFCATAAMTEVEEEDTTTYSSRRRGGGGGGKASAWKPPKDESGGHSRAPNFTVPYRSILLARAEHAMPKLKPMDARGAALRSSLLSQGRPGHSHPQEAVHPHPTEFYSSVMVCHACYVVYCRLDKARANICGTPLNRR